MYIYKMSSFRDSIASHIEGVISSSLVPIVQYVIEHINDFSDDPDVDVLAEQIASELQIEARVEKSTAKRSTANEVASKTKGLSAGKAATGAKKSRTVKKESDDNRWFDKKTFESMLGDTDDHKSTPEERCEANLCSYNPPRGQNKGLFCGAAASHYGNEDTDDYTLFRCEACKEKSGRGAKLLEGDDTVSTKRNTKKNVPGVNSRSKTAPTKNSSKSKTKKDDEENDDDGKTVSVTENDSLIKLLGKEFFICENEGIENSIILINDGECTLFGHYTGDEEINENTDFTPELLEEFVNYSSKNKEAMKVATSLQMTVSTVEEMMEYLEKSQEKHSSKKKDDKKKKPAKVQDDDEDEDESSKKKDDKKKKASKVQDESPKKKDKKKEKDPEPEDDEDDSPKKKDNKKKKETEPEDDEDSSSKKKDDKKKKPSKVQDQDEDDSPKKKDDKKKKEKDAEPEPEDDEDNSSKKKDDKRKKDDKKKKDKEPEAEADQNDEGKGVGNGNSSNKDDVLE